MAKQILSRERIKAFITEEMAKHEVCEGATADAYWHRRLGSFNWDVDIIPGGAASFAECEECDARLQEALQALRAKYDMVKPE